MLEGASAGVVCDCSGACYVDDPIPTSMLNLIGSLRSQITVAMILIPVRGPLSACFVPKLLGARLQVEQSGRLLGTINGIV